MSQAELVFLGLGEGNFIVAMAGEDLVKDQLVYQAGDGTWKLTDSGDPAKMPPRGLVLDELIEDELKGRILLHGIVGLASWSWAPGGVIYADTVAGGLTQTKPSPEDYQVTAVANYMSQAGSQWSIPEPAKGLSVKATIDGS